MSNSSGVRRLILEAQDGSISVDVPAQRVVDDPDLLAAHIARLESQGFTVLKDDATGADLPNERAGQSRRFRGCWRWDGSKIEVDLPMARAQVMAEVRAERNARLDAADRERNRLEDVGDQSQRQAHAAYRQSLRDLPAAAQADVDALGTAEDLEAYTVSWPAEPGA